MIATEAYIRRETLIAVVISVAITFVFFVIVFGASGPVEIWGQGKFVFDFAPQAFMIALMATLVPGAMTASKLRQGKLQSIEGRSKLPKALPLRALLIAAAAAVASVTLFAGLFFVSGLAAMNWFVALAVKLSFGGALAAVVTPIGLRAAMMASH
ncbi:hypothetical protein [Hyphococcus sp.]|uniref:hypothetical protein n=1 Tax=Hyphococcus sp. TaxID=2038636 RepID=UPI003D12A889